MSSGQGRRRAHLQPRPQRNLFAERRQHRLAAFACDAASSIPCDSSPRILRGARFVITMIRRPIRSSGAYHSAIPERICRFLSQIHLQPQQLIGLRNPLRHQDLRHPQLHLHKVVDGDLRRALRLRRQRSRRPQPQTCRWRAPRYATASRAGRLVSAMLPPTGSTGHGIQRGGARRRSRSRAARRDGDAGPWALYQRG